MKRHVARRGRIAIKLAAAVVAAIVIVLLVAMPNEQEAHPAVGLALAADSSQETSAEPASLAGAANEAASDRRVNSKAKEEPAAEPKEELQTPLEEGRPVRVVASDDGRALPGARVTFIEMKQKNRDSVPVRGTLTRSVVENYYEPEKELNEQGVQFEADEEGTLFVPPGNGLLMGRSGELWSLIELPDDALEAVVFVLEPDTSISIRLLDQEKKPVVGVTLQLQHRPEVRPSLSMDAKTDKDTGEARFEHLGWRVRQATGGLFGSRGKMGQYVILPIVHLTAAPQYVVDPEQLPDAPVELILPPAGSVLMRVSSTGSRPLRYDKVQTDLLETRIDDRDERAVVNWTIPIQSLDARGESSYPYVGLGLEFDAQVWLAGANRQHEVRFKGPQVSGQRVVLDVVIPQDYPVLAMRVVNEQGKALAEQSISISLQSVTGGTYDSLSSRSDKEGHVEFHFESDYEEWSGKNIQVQVEAYYTGGLQRTSFAWNAPNVGGFFDLGDKRLAASPSLASGVVRGPGGTPLEGVRVSARIVRDSSGRKRSYGIPGAACKTDESGAFELRGFTKDLNLELHFKHPASVSKQLSDIPARSSNLDVTLDTAGTLAGRVILHDFVSANSISIGIARLGPASKNYSAFKRSQTPREDGTFFFRYLPTGQYRLTLSLEGSELPLVIIDDLEVKMGECCRDKRIAAITIPQLKHFEFTVVDTNGKPPAWGEINLRSPGSTESFDDSPSYGIDGGYCSVLTTLSSFDLRIQGARLRPLEVLGVRSSRRFELRPWLRALVVLRGEKPVVPDGFKLFAGLSQSDEEDSDYTEYFDDQSLEAEGEKGWWLSEPGAWKLEVYVIETEPGRNESAKLKWNEPVFQVLDTDDEQRFEVALDSQEFRAALATAIAEAKELDSNDE